MQKKQNTGNRGVPHWKHWSLVSKAQVIAGTIGALVTLAMNAPFTVDPYSPMADFLFQFGLILMKPTIAIWNGLGAETAQQPLLFIAMEVVVNFCLFLIIGTVIGVLVSSLRKNKR